jgi:hypothetical protein
MLLEGDAGTDRVSHHQTAGQTTAGKHENQQADDEHGQHVQHAERRQRAGAALEAGEKVGDCRRLFVRNLLTGDQHAAGKNRGEHESGPPVDRSRGMIASPR